MYERELEVALQATLQASRLCQRVQSGVTPETLEKRDKSPVTVADFGSQAIIANALREAFPTIPLIAEEGSEALRAAGNEEKLQRVRDEVAQELEQPTLEASTVCDWIDHGNASEYTDLFWTLDPIDGTKGFLRGQQYAIALALVHEGQPICAALACPNLPNDDGSMGAVLIANDGKAHQVNPITGEQARIAVSEKMPISESRFCESVESAHSDHSHSKSIAEHLGISAESVRMDSQAKYAAVARGDAEIYLRLPTRPGYVERIWDHAAGYAVLKAAGGSITDVDGNALDFRHGRGLEKNRGVVASSGHMHAELIAAIKATS